MARGGGKQKAPPSSMPAAETAAPAARQPEKRPSFGRAAVRRRDATPKAPLDPDPNARLDTAVAAEPAAAPAARATDFAASAAATSKEVKQTLGKVDFV